NTEAEVIASNAADVRTDADNLRVYEFAGCSHGRQVDAFTIGLPTPQKANPADFTPFLRALFIAANNWRNGVAPPPSIWMGAPGDSTIARDAKGNALIRFAGGGAVNSNGYRLPEVAVGKNCYIAVDPTYKTNTIIGLLSFLFGGFVDLTG